MNDMPCARIRQGFRGPRHVAGVGMIEVLIAIVILAFGLLGIAALQMTALRGSQSSLQRSQANRAGKVRIARCEISRSPRQRLWIARARPSKLCRFGEKPC